LDPLAAQADAQRARAWHKVPFREMASLHALLIGFGAIGREISKRLAPFGARITVVRRTPDAGAPDVEQRPLADMRAVLPSADLVVMACALNDETRGVADAEFFAAMKAGGVFINVARGGLVVEDALHDGLAAGKPGFAVLDVFAHEPLSQESWLWDHPQVRVTAHAANEGDGVSARGDVLFLDNLQRYLTRRDASVKRR
jgi:phosphoglycerate dehydrogenase-like enzyme